MARFNDDPHPRVLFFGIGDDDIEAMRALVPTARIVEWNETVEEDEYDAAVTTEEDPGRLSPHLHVLAIDARTLDMEDLGEGHSTSFGRYFQTHADQLEIPDELPTDLQRLISRSIVPNLSRGTEKHTWGYHVSRFQSPTSDVNTGDLKGNCVPFLHVGPARMPIALERRRKGRHSAICWAIPAETTERAEWFRLFLKRVREVDPDKFAGDAEWRTSPDWAPPQTLKHIQERNALSTTREEFLAESDRQIRKNEQALKASLDEANGGALRLVTRQGEPLVDAVTNVMTQFGFTVENMDPIHVARHGTKFEDLQVRDPDDSDWVAIVEVKGFSKGVKVNEIAKITQRPVVQFLKDNNKAPSAVWAIANHNMTLDPQHRGPFVGNPDVDLHNFQNVDGGACFDTRDIYRLWRAVESGETSPQAARTALKSASLLWAGPAMRGAEAPPKVATA